MNATRNASRDHPQSDSKGKNGVAPIAHSDRPRMVEKMVHAFGSSFGGLQQRQQPQHLGVEFARLSKSFLRDCLINQFWMNILNKSQMTIPINAANAVPNTSIGDLTRGVVKATHC